jgi:phosphomannomutase / phosphoglucomutase
MKDSIRQQLVQIRPAMKPLAVLCALLALWLGWSGIAQFRDNERRSDLETTRDNGVQLVHQAMLQSQKRLT